MRLVFRVDASVAVGTGHLMRCLVLGRRAAELGHSVTFAMAAPDEHIEELVRRERFRVVRLPGQDHGASPWPVEKQWSDAGSLKAADLDADVVVVDHYGLDESWHRSIGARRLMVIDDLANRSYACDLLLDQNPYDDLERRYDGRVPEGCTLLLGPAYTLLRDEFYRGERRSPREKGSVWRVLVFYGGTDPTNETSKALTALRTWRGAALAVDVVVGSANPFRHEIEQACAAIPCATLHVQTDRMAELVGAAHIALGSGGSAVLERCVLGVPTLATLIAGNQVELSQALERRGAIRILGSASQVDAERIRSALSEVLDAPHSLDVMAAAGRAMFDLAGKRGVDRVLEALEAIA